MSNTNAIKEREDYISTKEGKVIAFLYEVGLEAETFRLQNADKRPTLDDFLGDYGFEVEEAIDMYILITYRPVARKYKISDKLCHKLALAARAIKLYEYYPNNKDRDGIRDVVHEICLRYDELDDLLNDLKDISEKTGVSKKVVLELIHIVKCIDTYWETLRKEPNNEDNTNNR